MRFWRRKIFILLKSVDKYLIIFEQRFKTYLDMFLTVIMVITNVKLAEVNNSLIQRQIILAEKEAVWEDLKNQPIFELDITQDMDRHLAGMSLDDFLDWFDERKIYIEISKDGPWWRMSDWDYVQAFQEFWPERDAFLHSYAEQAVEKRLKRYYDEICSSGEYKYTIMNRGSNQFSNLFVLPETLLILFKYGKESDSVLLLRMGDVYNEMDSDSLYVYEHDHDLQRIVSSYFEKMEKELPFDDFRWLEIVNIKYIDYKGNAKTNIYAVDDEYLIPYMDSDYCDYDLEGASCSIEYTYTELMDTNTWDDICNFR